MTQEPQDVPQDLPQADVSHDPDRLTDVHSALRAAARETHQTPAMRNRSVRFPDALWEASSRVCAENGTDLPTFLRQCCTGLLRDYGAPLAEPQEPGDTLADPAL